LFWFVVTTTFAWSFFALGRHLRPRPAWPALAVGVALVAAAVDLVGVVANLSRTMDARSETPPPSSGSTLERSEELAEAPREERE
jgi:hypothetical protein